jgi:hypothetical protein
MNDLKPERAHLQKATGRGLGWGYLTGESRAIGAHLMLSVGGVENVISVFEEMERGELKHVDFIELQACPGGCVSGPLNIQNYFVARINLKEIVNIHQGDDSFYRDEDLKKFKEGNQFLGTEPILPRPIMALDADVSRALAKMERLDIITNSLPGLDCGACGSPSCRALAEDIVRGEAFDTDCVIKLREKVKTLAEEILDLARKLPPTMEDGLLQEKKEL